MTWNLTAFVPDGDEARRWAEQELSRPIYAEAKPTAFDLWSRDIAEFFNQLFSGGAGAPLGPAGLVIVIAIIAIVLVAALLYWGMPRRSRKSSKRTVQLLGADDDRNATQLRSEAARSARNGDFAAAIILRYRALARDLIERDVIDPPPGATAQAIAREAAAAFPAENAALLNAAGVFDDVRYVQHPGTEKSFQELVDLDERLSGTRAKLVPA